MRFHVMSGLLMPHPHTLDWVCILLRSIFPGIQLEAGYYPKSSFGTTTDPIFSLSHVQFSLPSSLIRMQVNSNILVMALHPLSLILLDLTKPVELVNVDLPKPASAREGDRERETPSIKGIWGDPSGRHLLITTHGGDTFYLSTSNLSSMISTSGTSKANKPRPLRLRHPISAVAWSPTSVSPAPTASSSSSHSHAHAHTVDCLLGSPNGVISTLTLPPSDDIFNLNLKGISKSYERDHNSVYTVPNQAAVTGLGFGFWDLPSHSASPPQQQIHGHGYQRKTANERQVWIVATTADRVYEMHGSVSSSSSSSGGMNMVGRSGWAEEIFRPYRETGNVPKFQEIEADEKTSMLRFYETMRPSSSSSGVGGLQAQDVAWSTKTGLYASPVPACLSATGTAPDVFASPRLLGYPAKDRLVDFLLTEFHTIFLFENRIVGVSRLTDSIVWEDTLPLKVDEHASSLAYDPVHHTYWMYTDRALYEIVTTDEDRNVWRAKLDHADFESAAKYAKTSAQIDLVHSRHADNLFENGKFVQAAQIYAKSSRSFEYVALRFIDADEKDALRMYLADRLDRLDKKDLTQRMMLATWLIEIYLSKCNTLEDIIAAEAATSDVESMRVELQLMAEDLRNFITTYKSNLDRKVTYEMILSHGRTDIYLFYAELVKDHKVIIEHWIKEEEWSRVIEDLGRQDDLELYYRFSTILMTHRPSSTVDSWLRVPSIDVRRLIPALLLGEVVESARFLQAVIARGSTDSTIFNLLITLLAQDNNETKLIEFLSNTPDDPLADKPYYDLDYALRTCKASGRISSTVYIYSRMGLYENSVDLAIERGDPELAKINADKVDDDDTLRRRLWLKIAKYVVQEKRDIKSAMQFLESTDLLRIEDILPFFPDFAVIDDFKDEICKALEDYRENIDNLKAEMDEATRSAASIQGEIEKLQNRFMTVDVSERCSHCQALLMTRQFYVFPCQHVFHVDCLITLVSRTERLVALCLAPSWTNTPQCYPPPPRRRNTSLRRLFDVSSISKMSS